MVKNLPCAQGDIGSFLVGELRSHMARAAKPMYPGGCLPQLLGPTRHNWSVRAPRGRIPLLQLKITRPVTETRCSQIYKLMKNSVEADSVTVMWDSALQNSRYLAILWGCQDEAEPNRPRSYPFHPNYCQIILISLICRDSE